MRLTLRTLLGYLDDILEPQQARELGEKISESTVAAGLVARIKDVVRRRRIGAPELTGPGSDPDGNVVAEYLDNTLSPEKIEDLERLCLDSDIHLAEVAACHQILTLVLGEPVEIQPGLRERMYVLGKVTEPDGEEKPRPATVPPSPSATPIRPSAPPPRPQVPDYLTNGSSWRRTVPVLVAILVLGVWIGLIVSDPAQSWRVWETDGSPVPDAALAQTDRPAGVPPAAQEQAPEPGVAAVPQAVPATPPAGVGVDLAGPRPDVQIRLPDEEAAASEGINPPPPPDLPDTPTPQSPDLATEPEMVTPPLSANAGEGPARGAGAVPVPGGATDQPPSSQSTAAAPAVEAERILYNSADGVLLHRDPASGWRVLPRRSLIRAGDEIASPAPFESSLQLLGLDTEIVLIGARVVLHPSAADTNAALAIDRGRLQFRRSPVAPAGKLVRIRLGIGGVTYALDLLEPGTTCGLQLEWKPFADSPQEASEPRLEGALYLSAGRAELRSEDGREWPLTAGAASLSFLNGTPATTLQPLLSPPDWMVPATGGTAAIARQTSRQFEESFQLDLPVSQTIPALVDNRHPRISEWATQTLALTDNYTALVRALSAPHEESRKAAINGLAAWILGSDERTAALAEELNRTFPAEVAATVLRLLQGFTLEDAHNPEISNQLVDWLMDGNVAIRELAFLQIRRLTGGTITYLYHPDRSETQRAASVRQWKSHLRREGALKPPAPTENTDGTE